MNISKTEKRYEVEFTASILALGDIYSIDTIAYAYSTTQPVQCNFSVYNYTASSWHTIESNTGTGWITGNYTLGTGESGTDRARIMVTTATYSDFDFYLDMLKIGYHQYFIPDSFDFTPTTGIESPELDGNYTLNWEQESYTDGWDIQLWHPLNASWTTIAYNLTTNSLEFTNQLPGVHLYRARAYNDLGERYSSNSASVLVYGPPRSFNFAATPVTGYENPDTDGRFTLHWEEASSAVNISIYRDGALVASGIDGDAVNYTLTEQPGGTHVYIIEAINAYGRTNSTSSLQVAVQMDSGGLSPEQITLIVVIAAAAGVAVLVSLKVVSNKKKKR